jgi:hypothetical protein
MNTPILPATKFAKREDTRYRNIGGEGIVVRQTAGEVLVLSEVGARVVDLIGSANHVDAVLSALATEYDVDPAVLEKDVLAYLQELVDAGVIHCVAA